MTRHIPLAVYGETGLGKTLDVASAFRKSLWLMTDPDGLSSVQTHLGFVPANIELTDLDQPYREIDSMISGPVAAAVQAGEYNAVVLDTGTELARRLLAECYAVFGNDPRRVYPETSRRFAYLVKRLLTLTTPREIMFAVTIFQEARPKVDEKRGFVKGGPKLPGSLAEEIPELYSVLLRGAVDGGERVYICDLLDTQWYMKDRCGVTTESQPMDLRPIIHGIVRPGQPIPQFPPKVRGNR